LWFVDVEKPAGAVSTDSVFLIKLRVMEMRAGSNGLLRSVCDPQVGRLELGKDAGISALEAAIQWR